MKYLRLFQNDSQYSEFLTASDYIEPHVVMIQAGSEEPILYFKSLAEPGLPDQPTTPEGPISLGDIAYWDGSTVKTISSDKWTTSLGTPVGVVVIPEGMLPDGKARIISLKYVNADGTPSDSVQTLKWGVNGTDTSLTNYNRVPTTDNAGSTSTGSNSYGYLPSDNFTGATSFVDSAAKYRGTSSTSRIPSPYLGDNSTFNTEYSKAISGYNNLLSDFNGLTNTQTLVGLGSGYEAANACWNYTGGVNGTGLQWYLPAMGELGFLMIRFKAINNAITTAGGVAVDTYYFWSSSEYLSKYAYCLYTSDGYVDITGKDYNIYVRPFAALA